MMTLQFMTRGLPANLATPAVALVSRLTDSIPVHGLRASTPANTALPQVGVRSRKRVANPTTSLKCYRVDTFTPLIPRHRHQAFCPFIPRGLPKVSIGQMSSLFCCHLKTLISFAQGIGTFTFQDKRTSLMITDIPTGPSTFIKWIKHLATGAGT